MIREAGSAHTRSGPTTAVVVLGAGRSGTSALTRGLTALGVDLGANLRGAGGKNPTGFFEDRDVLALAQRLKRAIGIRGHSLRLIDDAVWARADVQSLVVAGADRLGRRFGGTPLWGFKYGRTLRTLPFWQAVLDAMNARPRYVVALRNPLSVARSRARLNPQRGHQAWSDLEWLVNVVPYLERAAGAPISVVDFDRLMADPVAQLERIARDLDLALGAEKSESIDAYAREFVQPDRPRSRFSRADLAADPAVNRWVAESYGLLDQIAGDERSLDECFWQAWRPLVASVHDLTPILAELDAINGERLRTRWNPASTLGALRQSVRDWRSR